jgi:malate/lactate dehydrogenase
MGVPVVLGGEGMERIIEPKLTPREQDLFNQSAAKVRKSIELLDQLI